MTTELLTPTGAPSSSFREWFRRYGAFALALFLLATSKWGSYLPSGHPPYISDIVIGGLLLQRILAGRSDPRAGPVKDGSWLRPAVAVLLFWCLLEFTTGSLSQNALRDGAPYLYAVVVFLAAAPAVGARLKIARAIDVSLIFHAAWISVVLAAPSVYNVVPHLGQIYPFQLRNDFDGTVCAIFAALSFHRALCGRRIIRNVIYSGWGVALTLLLRERAALLALISLIVVVAVLAVHRRRSRWVDRAKALVPIVIICLPLMYMEVSQTFGYKRFVSGLQGYVPFIPAGPSVGGAVGTTHARLKAWTAVIDYLEPSPRREWVGVGFGPDFMHSSGADVLLLGNINPDVRSPHNYFVGTWARLGLIGLALDVLVIVGGLHLAIVLRRRAPELTDVDVLAIMATVALPVAASVGVILESPFGAVPYFWALGHMSARVAELRRGPVPLPTLPVGAVVSGR